MDTGKEQRKRWCHRSRGSAEGNPPTRASEAEQRHSRCGIAGWWIGGSLPCPKHGDTVKPRRAPAADRTAEVAREDMPALHQAWKEDKKRFRVMLGTAQVIRELDMHRG